MRMVCGIGVLALALSLACANKSDLRTTTPQPDAAVGGGAGADARAANTAGAQAAARLTVQDNEAREQSIGSTYPEMRKNLAAKMTDKAADQAQELALWFGDVERFWAQNNKPGAVKLAQTARTLATEVAGAATAGDVAKANQAATKMEGACNQCHGTYREADPAGGFRVKAGMVTPG